MYPIIDVHCHVYPPKIAAKATEATSSFYGSDHRNEDGLVETLLRENAEAGICHSIICSVATTPRQVRSINRYIHECVQRFPQRLTGFGTLYPSSPSTESDLEEALSFGLKGIKLHPDIQHCSMTDPAFLRAFELCAERNLPVLVHTGDVRYAYSNPEQIIPVLKAFPSLVMIGAHYGAYRNWEDGPKKLFGLPNFYVDCSSSSYALPAEKATELIRGYGADHVLFGTDYPMWHPKKETELFLSYSLTEEERRLILGQNAMDLFHLDVIPL